jgi:phosphate-selective porin
VGAVGPAWNGGFVEAHYNYNPRFIAIGRYELIRMARQANPDIRANSGNLDTWTLGYRWYPIMNPRAGLAWIQEYSRVLNAGAAPISGKDSISNSLLMGFDFDF